MSHSDCGKGTFGLPSTLILLVVLRVVVGMENNDLDACFTSRRRSIVVCALAFLPVNKRQRRYCISIMSAKRANPEEKVLESRIRPRPMPPSVPERDVPPASNHLHEFATSPFYIEELAYHHYHAFASEDADLDQLGPLPPPPSEIPSPPVHCSITWTYDPESRVYLGDFSSVAVIPKDQKLFLGSLMERDDITVIMEGLYEEVTDAKNFLGLLGCRFDRRRFGKFRRFKRCHSPETGFTDYEEVDGYITMNVNQDYLNYVARKAYGGSDFWSCAFDLQMPIETKADAGSDLVITTDLAVEANTARKTNATPGPLDDTSHDQSISMTDVEMTRHFPQFNRDYKQKFKMKEILPGGDWCLMSHVCEHSCLAVFPLALSMHLTNPFSPLVV
jgi:hypothetical protein